MQNTEAYIPPHIRKFQKAASDKTGITEPIPVATLSPKSKAITILPPEPVATPEVVVKSPSPQISQSVANIVQAATNLTSETPADVSAMADVAKVSTVAARNPAALGKIDPVRNKKLESYLSQFAAAREYLGDVSMVH
jgi:hypothetical protein